MVADFPRWQDTRKLSEAAGAAVRLHVDRQGSGPAVVLAHGFGGSARNFLPQARFLRSLHKVWLYDMRGHARSDAPTRCDAYGWPALLDDFHGVSVAASSDAANPVKRPLVVGGLSLGAATALLWSLQTPLAIDGLVLAAYPNSGETQRQWALDFAASIIDEGLEKAGSRFVWGFQAAFGNADAGMIRRGFMEHSPEALAAILRLALANLPDIGSMVPALKELNIPTLIMVGDNDTLSLAASRELASHISNSRLAIIERAGHVVNLSQPEAVNQELARFFDYLASKQAHIT